jgi:hypothetical protein
VLQAACPAKVVVVASFSWLRLAMSRRMCDDGQREPGPRLTGDSLGGEIRSGPGISISAPTLAVLFGRRTVYFDPT